MDLFKASVDRSKLPLSERMRPQKVAEVLGQEHVISQKMPLGKLLLNGHLMNLIITGPPGTGKTSFARALSNTAKARFVALNAVDSGVKDLKLVAEEAQKALYQNSEKTLVFVDEIHRFNKSQQDVLLPYVEKGEIYLVGATTENPSYELNRALLSRCQVIQFKRVESDSFFKLIELVKEKENFDLKKLLAADSLDYLISFADGDARRFLNAAESIIELSKLTEEYFPLGLDKLKELLGNQVLSYDKASDQHYDCISAFIKSIRGSDVDAALYYFARMVLGGEDPVFIARRLIILASEDVGNADPRGLPLAIAGLQAVESIGLPEAAINLSQVISFLATAPKSNRSYMAWNQAKEFVTQTGSVDLPYHLKSSNKGNDTYLYPHSYEKGYVEQNYWPHAVSSQKFYEPSQRGYEKHISDYLKWLKGQSSADLEKK